MFLCFVECINETESKNVMIFYSGESVHVLSVLLDSIGFQIFKKLGVKFNDLLL